MGSLAACGCGPVEAQSISLAEYQALMIGWNELHADETENDAPDLDFVKSEMARLSGSPLTR